MAEVSTASNNEAAATQSLSLLAVWFAVCCSSNLSTHSSKPQPCSWNGCQIHALVGTEHRNSLPHTLCSDSAQLPSPAPSTLKMPQHWAPASQGFTEVQQHRGGRGFIPDLHFQFSQAGAGDSSLLTNWANFLPCQVSLPSFPWWPHRAAGTGSINEPQEQ